MPSNSFASASVAIVAPPSRVWDVLVHVEQWPEWTPTVLAVERLDTGPLSIGSRTRIHQPKLRPAVWQVTELDQAKGVFIWIARSPGITVTAGHCIDRTPLGSHATLTISFSGVLAPLVRLPMGKLTRQYVQTEAESLKQRSETWRQQRTGS